MIILWRANSLTAREVAQWYKRFCLKFRCLCILVIAFGLMTWFITVPINAQETAEGNVKPDEAKQIDAAITELEYLLVNNPENIGVKMSLANLYMQQGNINKAVKELEQVINLKPDYKPAYVELVIAYLDMQANAYAAEKILEQALNYFQKDGALNSLMGHVQIKQAQYLFSQNKLEEAMLKAISARSHFGLATENLPRDDMLAAAYLGLGSSYHLEADLLRFQEKYVESVKATNEATNAYRQAITLQPELRSEIRELEIELALPPSRFPKSYSLIHRSVSLQERLKKIRSKIASVNESIKGDPK